MSTSRDLREHSTTRVIYMKMEAEEVITDGTIQKRQNKCPKSYDGWNRDSSSVSDHKRESRCVLGNTHGEYPAIGGLVQVEHETRQERDRNTACKYGQTATH
ncbi:hypothetical protein PAXRUDRAFT_835339 [Paxillus rubicundulus Ve08.2h10]|uniref:Uncharacterized protein n=1 Tax=Paxillus rubicundulus Ve08.2h10 TaxID=930991 RepID=A0A0D0CZ51_9AGAM|nr:hypothetical protein PAXRUDRAFT_835339 [Paxillus rubicundulus Ve08.2h10]